MGNNKYAPTMLDKFLYARVNIRSWILFMIMGVPLVIIATSILVSSIQSSLSFTPMEGGSKASGTIMAMGNMNKDYPNFNPDPRVAGFHYKEATVQYSYNSQSYNLKLDMPIPDMGKKVGDVIPLLINSNDPVRAVADIYPVPYNMVLIISMSILNAAGLSLVVVSLISRKRPVRTTLKR